MPWLDLLAYFVKLVPIPAVLTAIAILVRPRLQIDLHRPRCREIVELRGRPGVNVAVLRLWVENMGWRQTETTAFIEVVRLNDTVVEPERSLLNSWADRGSDHEILGHQKGKYVNLCQVVQECPDVLWFYTVKGAAGYNFTRPGLYRITVSAHGKGLHTGDRLNVEIRHDGTMKGLDFLSADGHAKQLRIGDFLLGKIASDE
jgi:hypothetical protein